jgi:RNA polymerase sigma-70 factor (ECF subfamily)
MTPILLQKTLLRLVNTGIITISAQGDARPVKRQTDEQLMERLQQGQTDALDELYNRYVRRLHAYCWSITRSSGLQDPEDLVQDVFLRLIKGAHTFDPERASFRTWVFRIARNRCTDAMRRAKLLRFVPLGSRVGRDASAGESEAEGALVDPRENVKDSVLRALAIEAVRNCIDELGNPDEKQAIVLYYLGGKVYREIGQVLGKSTSMARNRVKAAREKVRRCLERRGITPVS